MRRAGLLTFLVLASAQAGCQPASQTSPKPDTYPWLRPWMVEELQRVRSYAPTPVAGMQRECLGRLAFEVKPGTEWAADRLEKIEDGEIAEFPDRLPGDRQERLAYGDLHIWVSGPATHADMEAAREQRIFSERATDAEGWDLRIKKLDAELKDAKLRNAELEVGWIESRISESNQKLENARHQKRLNFGMPDE